MIDIKVTYVITTPGADALGEYAGVFNTRAAAVEALATWGRYSGVRKAARLYPRICPTMVVHGSRFNPKQHVTFEGGTY